MECQPAALRWGTHQHGRPRHQQLHGVQQEYPEGQHMFPSPFPMQQRQPSPLQQCSEQLSLQAQTDLQRLSVGPPQYQHQYPGRQHQHRFPSPSSADVWCGHQPSGYAETAVQRKELVCSSRIGWSEFNSGNSWNNGYFHGNHEVIEDSFSSNGYPGGSYNGRCMYGEDYWNMPLPYSDHSSGNQASCSVEMHKNIENTASLSWHDSSSVVQNVHRSSPMNSGTGSWNPTTNKGYSELSRGSDGGQCNGGILEDFRSVSNQEGEQQWYIPIKQEPDSAHSSSSVQCQDCSPSTLQGQQDGSNESNLYPSQVCNYPIRLSSTSSPLQDASSMASFNPQISGESLSAKLQKIENRQRSSSSREHQAVPSSTPCHFQENPVGSPSLSGIKQRVSNFPQLLNHSRQKYLLQQCLARKSRYQQKHQLKQRVFKHRMQQIQPTQQLQHIEQNQHLPEQFHVQHNQNPQHHLLQQESLQQKQHCQLQQPPKHQSQLSKSQVPSSTSPWQMSRSKQPSTSSASREASSLSSASEVQVLTPQLQSSHVQSVPHRVEPNPHHIQLRPSKVQQQLPCLQSHPCQVQSHCTQSLSYGPQLQPPSSRPQKEISTLQEAVSPEVKIISNPQSPEIEVLSLSLTERQPPPGQTLKEPRVHQQTSLRNQQHGLSPRKQHSSHVHLQMSNQLSSTNVIHSTPNQELNADFQQKTAISTQLPTAHEEPSLDVHEGHKESSTIYSNMSISATTTSPCISLPVTTLIPATSMTGSATVTTSASTTSTNLLTSTSTDSTTTNTSTTLTSACTTSTNVTNTLDQRTPHSKDKSNLVMPKLTRLSDDPTFFKKKFRRQLGKFARMLEGEEFPNLYSKPRSSCKRSSGSSNRNTHPTAASSSVSTTSLVYNSPHLQHPSTTTSGSLSTFRVSPSSSDSATPKSVSLAGNQLNCGLPLDVTVSSVTCNSAAPLPPPPPLIHAPCVNSSTNESSSPTTCYSPSCPPTTPSVDASLSTSFNTASANSSTLSAVCSSVSFPSSSSPLCSTSSSPSTVTLSNNEKKVTIQETELDQSIALLEEFLDLSSLVDKYSQSSATLDGNSTTSVKLSAALYSKSRDVTDKNPGHTGPASVTNTTSIPEDVSASVVDEECPNTISTDSTTKTSSPLIANTDATTAICSTADISHHYVHGASSLLNHPSSPQKSSSLINTFSSIPSSSHSLSDSSPHVNDASVPHSKASPPILSTFPTLPQPSLVSHCHPSPTLPNTSPSLPLPSNTPHSSTPTITSAYQSPFITHFPSPSYPSSHVHQPTSFPSITPSPPVSNAAVAYHLITPPLSSNIPSPSHLHSPSLPTQFPSPALPLPNSSHLVQVEAIKPGNTGTEGTDFDKSYNKTAPSPIDSDPDVQSHECEANVGASDVPKSNASVSNGTAECTAGKNDLVSGGADLSVYVKGHVAKGRKVPHSDTNVSLPSPRPKGTFTDIQCMQARFSAYLEPSMELPCLQCRQVVPGSDILHHLFFSQIECATCHISINTCAEFRSLEALSRPCKSIRIPRRRGKALPERCEKTTKQVGEVGGGQTMSHVEGSKENVCTRKENRESNSKGIKFKIHYGGGGTGEGRTSIQVGEGSQTQHTSGKHTWLRWAQDPVGVVYYHMRRKLATKLFYAGKDRNHTSEDVMQEMVKFVAKFAPLKQYLPWSDAIQKCWKYIYSMKYTGDVTKDIRENKRKRSTKDKPEEKTNAAIQQGAEENVERKQKVGSKVEEKEKFNRGIEKKMKASIECEGKQQVEEDATKDDGNVSKSKEKTENKKIMKNVGGMTLRKRKEGAVEHKNNEETPAKRRRKERNKDGTVSTSNDIWKVRLRNRGRGAPRKRMLRGRGRMGRKRGRGRHRVVEEKNTRIKLNGDVSKVGADKEITKNAHTGNKYITEISEKEGKQAGHIIKNKTSDNMGDKASNRREEAQESHLLEDHLKSAEEPEKLIIDSGGEGKEKTKGEGKVDFTDKRACFEQRHISFNSSGVTSEVMARNVMKEKTTTQMDGWFTTLPNQSQSHGDSNEKLGDQKTDKNGKGIKNEYLDTMHGEDIMEEELVMSHVERLFNKVADTLIKHYHRRNSLSPRVTDEEKTGVEVREENNDEGKNIPKLIKTMTGAVAWNEKMDHIENCEESKGSTHEEKMPHEEIIEEDSRDMEVKEEQLEEEVMRGKEKSPLEAAGNGTPAMRMLKVEESKVKKMKAKIESDVVTEGAEEDTEEYGDLLLSQSYSSDHLESVVQYVTVVD